jgi:subtilisin family serine protease
VNIKGKLIGTLLALLLLNGGIPRGSQASPVFSHPYSPNPVVSSQIIAAMANLKPGEMITVILTFREQPDLSQVNQIEVNSRAEVQENLIHYLQSTSQSHQSRVHQTIESRIAQGKAAEMIPFWIFNGMAITATREVIEELYNFPEILSITPNLLFEAPDLTSESVSSESNLNIINAPEMWNSGYQGQGVVVANMDTGVFLDHPDLAEQWRGGTNSWFDPYGQHPEFPADLHGHGTWTMGVMVGRGDEDEPIGVAPGAQWIAVKIFDDSGWATSAAIHQGFQWLLDPDGDPATDDAPHIVNNSWSYLSTGCYLDFQADLRALRAAGILPVFAAGNLGPEVGTSVSPANYPEALAVGAIDSLNQIDRLSSRGPNTCGGSNGVYPQLVAPGVKIYSTSLDGSYSRTTGTSLAAPHVSGALALLLSAYPDLTVEQQEQALLITAIDIGDPGPDEIFGYGRLDVLAAYLWLNAEVYGNPSIPSDDPLRLFLPHIARGNFLP